MLVVNVRNGWKADIRLHSVLQAYRARMKCLQAVLAMVAAAVPMQHAFACPPPPPGWVPPTQEQRLQRSLADATDIVYGIVTRTNQPGQPALFKVHHVYRGKSTKGQTSKLLSAGATRNQSASA